MSSTVFLGLTRWASEEFPLFSLLKCGSDLKHEASVSRPFMHLIRDNLHWFCGLYDRYNLTNAMCYFSFSHQYFCFCKFSGIKQDRCVGRSFFATWMRIVREESHTILHRNGNPSTAHPCPTRPTECGPRPRSLSRTSTSGKFFIVLESVGNMCIFCGWPLAISMKSGFKILFMIFLIDVHVEVPVIWLADFLNFKWNIRGFAGESR